MQTYYAETNRSRELGSRHAFIQDASLGTGLRSDLRIPLSYIFSCYFEARERLTAFKPPISRLVLTLTACPWIVAIRHALHLAAHRAKVQTRDTLTWAVSIVQSRPHQQRRNYGLIEDLYGAMASTNPRPSLASRNASRQIPTAPWDTGAWLMPQRLTTTSLGHYLRKLN